MSWSHITAQWVLIARTTDQETQRELEALRRSAVRTWPHVLAHGCRELSDGHETDKTSFVAEVWEGVLQSVWRTLHRHRQPTRILDLDEYLMGIFHHRFNKLLKKERQRQRTVEFMPLEELAKLKGSIDVDWVPDFERGLRLREVVARMDEWTKHAWTARQYGYSWKEIARDLRLGEHQAQMRFTRSLEKIRTQLSERTKSPS